ncbi:MAG: type I secretion C-terminal target domain-containing protein [Aulosira sp. DedQUE10]|nr:type I secretion C-terminal target domain-containing protein [Aulosira sp. DedQUE10]
MLTVRDRGDTITDFEVGKDNIVLTQLLDSLVTGGYNGTNAIADGYVKVVQGTKEAQ